MINIADRPQEADDRAVPGHWEGDLLIGKANRSAIATLVERTTGYALLVALPDGYKPEQVAEALAAKIQTLPDSLRRSLSWDQGPEMRDWKQIRVDTGIEVYFCDPHSPWQRGTNENTNGLLRQYFPKGTDLSTLTDADLDRVADELNDRPRKRLGFYKPTVGRAAGESVRCIARRLGRSPSTVSRELARNADRRGEYRATTAHAQAWERACRPKPAKLIVNGRLREIVQRDLERKYSPEQIAGRLRLAFPDDPEMWVSAETIYQSLYVTSRGALQRTHRRAVRAARRQLVVSATPFPCFGGWRLPA